MRLERRLPALLSVIAGMVDVIGFLSLGLFTAHVTGNLVVIAALLVRGGPPQMAQIVAVPVFIVAVAVAWLIAKASHRRGRALVRPLLLVQLLLLAGVLILAVITDSATDPHGLMAGVTAMIAVSVSSPWQNAYAERVIGSIRQECLDHVVVLGERHLLRLLSNYVAYYNGTRTHLSLTKDAPEQRRVQPPIRGRVVEVVRVGGLRHEYLRRAA
jgi:Protein of unknown function (DUF1275)/Integrase core domain